MFTSSLLYNESDFNPESIEGPEKLLCTIQTITSDFPRSLMVYSYVIGMCGRIIATYAPLKYYKYFKAKVVVELLCLCAFFALVGTVTEIFVVEKAYAGNVGMCAGTSAESYPTVHLICLAMIMILALIFQVTAYGIIIKKYVRNKVSVAADLSDDASKGILIAATSYGIFSLIFPQELVIMFYLIANITIGAYMMKERNMTSSESNHNKETFFFLRLSSIYIVVMCLTVAYYACYIYYRVTYSKSEVEIMHTYYNAIILFYVKELANILLGLINMFQMWKHTKDLRNRLDESFLDGLKRKGAFEMNIMKDSKVSAWMKMNNVKKPSIFKVKRKIVRTSDGRIKLSRKRRYRERDEEKEKERLAAIKPVDPPKTGTLGKRLSLKRLGSTKSVTNKQPPSDLSTIKEVKEPKAHDPVKKDGSIKKEGSMKRAGEKLKDWDTSSLSSFKRLSLKRKEGSVKKKDGEESMKKKDSRSDTKVKDGSLTKIKDPKIDFGEPSGSNKSSKRSGSKKGRSKPDDDIIPDPWV
eukprot:sb/3463823/